MTDNTSPVATLAAKLPKGNGLTRAVPTLFEQRGALVPFVGYLRIEEAGLDAEDVQHLKTSIARFELCLGDLDRDAKDLVARASHAANAHPGQMTLMAEPGTAAARAEERDGYIRDLREWQKEQDPPLSDADAGERWTNFSGGHYGDLDTAEPAFLREFLLNLGALPDEPVVPPPAFSDDPGDDGSEPEPDEQ